MSTNWHKAIGYLILVMTISNVLGISYTNFQAFLIGASAFLLAQKEEIVFNINYKEKDDEHGRKD